MALERASFEIDGTAFPGYYDRNDDWNGFAVPFFTRDIAESIARHWSKKAEAYPDSGVQTIAYDTASDCYILREDCDTVEFGVGLPVETSDGVLTLYDVGAGYWAWSELETAQGTGS